MEDVYYDLALKVIRHYFFSILSLILVSLDSIWEGNTQGPDYQEVKTIETILGAGCSGT